MCGICGTTVGDADVAIRRMNAAMVHRGPDDEGVYVDPESGVGLGARRLSIIDVEGGHQPISNEDGTVWAVLNGEIYNHPGLMERLRSRGHSLSSRADTEVLVHLYEDHGPDLVHALEGMFAFAIWDAREQLLLLGRDRFGEKPLVYLRDGPDFTFASELTALRAGADGAPWELDPRALDAYFTFGYTTGVGSVVQGVEQLEPGCTLVWQRSALEPSIRRYWSPPEMPAHDGTPLFDLAQEARELLEESVRSRLLSDVPLGVFLSGGVDSTLVAALAASQGKGRLKTFTVGYDTGTFSETDPARRAAVAIGSEHHELILTQADIAARVPGYLAEVDEPIADEAFVALRALAEFARSSHVTVAVGGEGADELFGGYPRYRWLARAEHIPSWVPRRKAARIARATSRAARGDRIDRLHAVLVPVSPVERHVRWVTRGRPDLRARLYGARLVEALSVSHADRLGEVVNAPGNGSLGGSFMRLDQLRWLPDDVLVKADRATMLASLEFRTPFLSRQVAEFAASVPASTHFRGGGKYLLRRVLTEVLPKAAHGRRKVAFRTPTAEWLRGPLKPALVEQLESGALYEEGWFDRDALRAVTQEHLARVSDWSHVLWPLFSFGCWLDRFHERDS
jgi:asparagine synthase (glutamine-hydrolysing)